MTVFILLPLARNSVGWFPSSEAFNKQLAFNWSAALTNSWLAVPFWFFSPLLLSLQIWDLEAKYRTNSTRKSTKLFSSDQKAKTRTLDLVTEAAVILYAHALQWISQVQSKRGWWQQKCCCNFKQVDMSQPWELQVKDITFHCTRVAKQNLKSNPIKYFSCLIGS